MINFSDITYIKNHFKIGLINLKTSLFLNYDETDKLFRSDAVNPYLQNKDFNNFIISEFNIISCANPDIKNKNVLTYGSQVCLMTGQNMIITCLNNGEIKLENLKNTKLKYINDIPPNSKFFLVDPNNQSNISRPLLFNDKIILKSNFGNFLMIGQEGTVCCAAMIVSEETTWRITKTNFDQFPDWLTKRKYLNNNNISYLYNFEKFLENNNSGSNTNNNMGSSLTNMNINFSNFSKKSKNVIQNNQQNEKNSLMTLSTEDQEKCLIEDMLLIMIGRDGVYIKRSNKRDLSSEKNNSNFQILNSQPLNDFNTVVNSLDNSTMQNNIFKNFNMKFEVEPYYENPTCDPSLLFMVEKILPLSSYYDKIMNFLNLSSNAETGIITKSLMDAVEELIREYVIFVNQLEIDYISDNLDIQKLWYVCQSSLKILDYLQKLCSQTTFVKGGALINIIYDFLQGNTDLELEKMYKFLLEKSMKKYMNVMKQWVCKGMLIDNFEEFMVNQNKNFKKEKIGEYYYDLFWDKKFILNKINTPIFLREISEKILFIGKCLNILRECQIEFICPFEEEFNEFLNEDYIPLENKKTKDKNLFNYPNKENSFDEKIKKIEKISNKKTCIFESDVIIDFRNLIDKIYEWANFTLKNYLYQDCQIISILKSIKKFYFMECGDFYNYFIDLSDEILSVEKNVADIKKIDSIIDVALRSTSANLDPNKDLFTFNLSNMIVRTEKIYLEKYLKILDLNDIDDIMEKITELNDDKSFFEYNDSKVLESLILDISVKWPLNLIFSKKTIIKYKILFRQLLILKYEEKKLSEIWILQQNFKNIKIQNNLKPSYILRDRMINFIKSIIYYFFNEVIEPNYLLFLDNLSNSKSVDEIIFHHENFLDNCLKECLLDDSDILVLLNDIITTCLVYSKVIIKYYNSFITDMKLYYINEEEDMKYMDYAKRKKYKTEREFKIFEEIFFSDKFFETVEKFSQSFENRLESLINRINKL